MEMQGSLQFERTDCRVNPSGVSRSLISIAVWSGFLDVGQPTNGRGTLRIRPIMMSDEWCDRGVIPIKSSRTIYDSQTFHVLFNLNHDLAQYWPEPAKRALSTAIVASPP